jgi:CelD/BcsL family acetyltransferase involved in cellulose biosynthesis
MTMIEASAGGAAGVVDAAEAAMIQRVETHDDLPLLAAQWRVLQNSGLATPYQTYDWIRAWSDALCAPLGISPLVVTGHDGRGRAIALLPLGIRHSRGVTCGLFLGGRHANLNMGVFELQAMSGLSADDLGFMLRHVAERHAIDFFHFENQPRVWLGRDNPLLKLPHQSSASSAWKTALVPDGDEMIRGLMSSESRKKLRHKEKKLGESGPVSFLEARDAYDAETVLSAFYAQKAARFRAMGIADPFADSHVSAFLHTAATSGIAEGKQSISLFAMRMGERIISVFGGAIHQGRFTGMFTSFDGDPAVARYSPGDLLLLHLVKMMCARGLTSFDLGTGDASYKTDYCKTEEPLFDSFLPMTLTGQIAAAGMRSAFALKGTMKKSELALALVSRFRKLRGR